MHSLFDFVFCPGGMEGYGRRGNLLKMAGAILRALPLIDVEQNMMGKQITPRG